MNQNKNLLTPSSFEQSQIPNELSIQNINEINNLLEKQSLQSSDINSQDTASSPSSINSTECSFKVNYTVEKNKRLSFDPFLLERHNSGLHLNEQNPQQTNHKFNNINISLAPIEIVEKERINPLNQYNLNIDKVEHKICNDSDYFYINVKKNQNQNTSLNSNNNKKTLGLNYIPKILKKKNLMSPQEYKFDEEITACIKQGIGFSKIEQKFSHLLKE